MTGLSWVGRCFLLIPLTLINPDSHNSLAFFFFCVWKEEFTPGHRLGWQTVKVIFSTLRAKTDKCILQSGRRPVFTIRTCKSFLPSGGPRINGGFLVTLTLTLTCDWEIRTVERCECLRVDKFTRERMSASFTRSPGEALIPLRSAMLTFSGTGFPTF